MGPRPATRRLFFALWPDDALAAALDTVALAAAARFGGRPTRRATLHLTLAFLGDVADSELPKIIDAGQRIDATSFALQVNRLGFWRHNRLLWAGCAPSAGLERLVGQLHAALAEAGHPLAERQHAFTPHLTLLRKLPASTPPEAVAQFPIGNPAAWECCRFVLVQSKPSTVGSEYVRLAEFPLAA